MAGNTQELAIVISAKNQATAQLKAIRAQLAALTPLVAQINALSAASSTMAGSMASAGAAGAASVVGLNNFARALHESDVIARLSGKGLWVAGESIKKVGTETGKVVPVIGNLWKTLKKFVPVLGAVVAFRKLTQGVKAATQAVIDFNEALHDVWTLTDKTWAQIKKLGDGVRNFARGFNISATDATKALYQIYSATFYGADAMKILEASTKGAAAGLADVYEAADMTTTVLNAYRMSAEEANKVQDLLFTTVKYGKTRYGELTEQFGRLAGVAAPVGAGLAEMTAAIATLTRAGIETDWAVTSLRQTIMQMLRPTANLEKAVKDLGYASGPAMVKALGFADSLLAMADYAERNNVEMSEMFTNVRAITGVLPLTTTLAEEYAKDIDRMATAAGTMSIAFAKQAESWRYQLDKAKTAIKDTAISIGKAFVPALVALLKSLQALLYPLGKIMELFSAIGGDYMIAIVTVSGTLTGALWLMVKAWNAVAAAAARAGAAIAASSATMAATAGTTGITSGLLGALAGAPGGLLGGLGLATGGALALGASVKALVNFDFVLGNVTGVEKVKRALLNSIGAVLGSAAAGALIGSIFGGPLLGGVIGAAVGATAAATIYVVHEIREEADAHAATREEARKVIEENLSRIVPQLPTFVGGNTQELLFNKLTAYAIEFTKLDEEFAEGEGAVRAMREALMELYEEVRAKNLLWSPQLGYELDRRNLNQALYEQGAFSVEYSGGQDTGTVLSTVSDSVEEAREKLISLQSTMIDAGSTLSDTSMAWENIKNLASEWVNNVEVVQERAAALRAEAEKATDLDTKARLERQAKIAEASAKEVAAFSEILQKLVDEGATDSWANQIDELNDILKSGTATAKERAAAEQSLVSLYTELKRTVEISSLPEVVTAAQAAMEAIEALGLNLDDLGTISDTWANQISQLGNVLRSGTATAKERASAEQALISLYAQLDSIAKNSSFPGVITAAENAMKAIEKFGIKLGEMVDSLAAKLYAAPLGTMPTNMINRLKEILNIFREGTEQTLHRTPGLPYREFTWYEDVELTGERALELSSEIDEVIITVAQLDNMFENLDLQGTDLYEKHEQVRAELAKFIPALRKTNETMMSVISDWGGVAQKGASMLFGEDAGRGVGIAVEGLVAIATGNIPGAIMAGLNAIGFAVDLAKRSAEEARERVEEATEGIWNAFQTLSQAAMSLAQGFVNLIAESDAYTALQDNLNKIMQLFRNAIASFLWPLVAIAEELGLLVGVTSTVTTTIEKETVARLNSLNVPVGYKLERAAWGVATPGQPWSEGADVGPGTTPGEGNGAEIEIPAWARAIIEPFMETIRKIGDSLKSFLDHIIAAAGIIAGPFAGAILAIIETFARPLEALGAWIEGTLAPDLAAFFTAFGEWWRTDVDPFLQKEVFPKLAEWGTAIYEWIKEDFLPFLKEYVWPFVKDDLWPVIVEGIEGLGAALKELWDYIVEHWPEIKELIVNKVKEWFNNLIGDVQNVITWLDLLITPLGTIGGLLGQFIAALWNAISGIPAFIVATLNLVYDIITYPFQFVAVILENLGIAIHNAIQWILNLLNPFSSGNQLEYKPLPTLQTKPGQWWNVDSTGMAIVHEGERVGRGGGDTYVYNVTLPGVTNAKQFDEELEKIIRRKNLRGTGNRIGSYAMSGV